MQGGRAQWTVYYTSPQSLITKFSYSLAQQHWGLLLNLFWFIKKSVQTLQPLIVIYRRGNFEYHHWELHQFFGYCLNPLDPRIFWDGTLGHIVPHNYDKQNYPIYRFKTWWKSLDTSNRKIINQFKLKRCWTNFIDWLELNIIILVL